MTRSRDVADTQDNLGGAVAPYVSGKNFIINGGMDIWQRGTTFSAGSTYNADRWWGNNSAVTTHWALESTIVPAGFTYSMKVSQTNNIAYALAAQPIETANVLALAGQTVTLSVYLASSASMTITPVLNYSTATDVAPGGTWTAITPTSGGSFTVNGTTFTRNSTVFAIPSTAKSLKVEMINTSLAVGAAFYFTGVQLELGSVATPFARAGGSIGGELALCQRYYWRNTSAVATTIMSTLGTAQSTTTVVMGMVNPVVMRVTATSIDYSGLVIWDTVNGFAISSATLSAALNSTPFITQFNAVTAGLTQFRPYYIYTNATNGYIGFSAEL